MNGPTETPEKAARRLSAPAIRDGYKPEALHTYTYPDGGVWYWRIRLKNPNTGEKWIRPMRLNGAGLELASPPSRTANRFTVCMTSQPGPMMG